MTTDPSKLVACVIDRGLFLPIALKLAESFSRTFYYCDCGQQYQAPNAGTIGRGMGAILALSSLFTILFVFLPGPLMDAAGTAAQALFR